MAQPSSPQSKNVQSKDIGGSDDGVICSATASKSRHHRTTDGDDRNIKPTEHDDDVSAALLAPTLTNPAAN